MPVPHCTGLLVQKRARAMGGSICLRLLLTATTSSLWLAMYVCRLAWVWSIQQQQLQIMEDGM